MMTFLGRVVYDRKKHPFKTKDVSRILQGMAEEKTFRQVGRELLKVELQIMFEMKPNLGDVLEFLRGLFTDVSGWYGTDVQTLYDGVGRGLEERGKRRPLA